MSAPVMVQPELWRIEIPAVPATAQRFAEAIEPFCLTVRWHGPEASDGWRVEGIAAAPFDRGAVHAAVAACALGVGVQPPRVLFAPVPDRDWVRDSLATFKPVRAGRFRVQGSHVTAAEEDAARRNGIVLTIDAGLDFGTGEHATTRGCLLALD
ncbi:MAG: 50S ribosomal protein L11 methyltransferase, partial [Alphaproteobacteria bacterium]|nr:50S ribosomal protein L11 methyltransferase [Alphaproteobacteria bacterium]